MTEKCPYLRTIQGGDESLDYCDLVDKWCLLTGGYTCEEYANFLAEETVNAR